VTNLISVAIGVTATRMFRLPQWVTPAIAFNNTTSLPLLLIKSLSATGILDSILSGDSDSASLAVDRATSYFLVNAMVNKSLTFALGPRLLKINEDEDSDDEGIDTANVHPAGDRYPIIQREDEENTLPPVAEEEEEEDVSAVTGDDFIDEGTSLLPRKLVRKGNKAAKAGSSRFQQYWDALPPWFQRVLDFSYQFVNAPLLGAVVGAILGLTPPLHRAFFNDSNEGGIFNAWLTSSIKNIGELFATLQILVVGVKLSQSLRKMKQGEESGRVPWECMTFITVVRFLIWPA